MALPHNGVTRRSGHLETPYGWETLNLGLIWLKKKIEKLRSRKNGDKWDKQKNIREETTKVKIEKVKTKEKESSQTLKIKNKNEICKRQSEKHGKRF